MGNKQTTFSHFFVLTSTKTKLWKERTKNIKRVSVEHFFASNQAFLFPSEANLSRGYNKWCACANVQIEDMSTIQFEASRYTKYQINEVCVCVCVCVYVCMCLCVCV